MYIITKEKKTYTIIILIDPKNISGLQLNYIKTNEYLMEYNLVNFSI